MNDSDKTSRDTLFAGELICRQPQEGYRFSIDAVLLAHFCLHWKKATILDLGCGSGILSLLLLYRSGDAVTSTVGLEYQQRLAENARSNAAVNHYGDRFTVVHGDLKEIGRYCGAESFSHVVCNPPFYGVGRGRKNVMDEKYLARHQAAATLDDVVAAAFFALKNRGSFAMIYPADATGSLLHALSSCRLQPKRIRLVYSYPEAEAASLILVESRKNGGENCRVLPPLYIYTHKNGTYTEEVESMYEPGSR